MNCKRAHACIRGDAAYPQLRGRAVLTEEKGCVTVQVWVRGLPEEGSFHALHIHDGESCCSAGFPESGSHFNPSGMPHPEHAGDLPPLLNCGGCAYLAAKTDRFTLDQVIGKVLIIHRDADDFKSQPAGNAGSKIACGKIQAV